MSAKKKNKRKPRKSNPFGFGSKRRSKPKFKYRTKKVFMKRRRRNPGDSMRDDLVVGGGAAGGIVISRAIPENLSFLSPYNNGIPGYVLNLASGLAVAWAIGKFLNMQNLARGVRYGTYAGVAARVVQDYAGKAYIVVQPSGSGTVSGLGRLPGDPAFNLRGLGSRYMNSYSPTPTSSGSDFTMQRPWLSDIPAAALPPAAAVAKVTGKTAAAPAAPLSGLGYNPNYRGRFAGGRFAA